MENPLRTDVRVLDGVHGGLEFRDGINWDAEGVEYSAEKFRCVFRAHQQARVWQEELRRPPSFLYK